MKCAYCQKEFIPSKNDPRIKFCSEKCRIANRNKNNYMKQYYAKHKDKWESRQKTEEYKRNKNTKRNNRYHTDIEYREKKKAKAREYNQQHPEKKFIQHLSEFELTIDDYNQMLESQNYRCAICGDEGNKENRFRKLSIDHGHKTGKVRGLLCSNCNFLLGQAKDDIGILRNAITYLEENQ